MDTGSVPLQEASLTVNEQVIVMSGQETIRVLEVGVDNPIQAEEVGKALEPAATDATGSKPADTSDPATKAVQLNPEHPGEEPVVIRGHDTNICADNLHPRNQPATADHCSLCAASCTTATSMLNTNLQATIQAPQAIQAPQVFHVQQAPLPQPVQVQAAVQQQPPVSAPNVIQPQMTTMVQASIQKPMEQQAQFAIQPASFAFNPTIISAAPFGGQAQLLGSLAASPVIANTFPSVQGLTGQIITNQQGQVIGTLPWVLNSAAFSTNATPAALPAPNVQMQAAITPQLLLNAQGQVIATLANSASQPATIRKQTPPELLLKPEQMQVMHPIQPAPAVSQPPVVISNTASTNSSGSTPASITCSETPTVGQLISKPQTPNVNEDGINLEEIREFAKNFKIRRLSLGLTQTQVGQALTATEGPAYSQSAICRFEKLDITPKSAQKLKPVLEKWLNEAELRNQEGQQNLMEFVGGEPSKKRKRRTSFTPQAIEILNAYFEKNALPTGQEITEIAKELNYDREVVRVWFCNRRQTLKNTSRLNVFQNP
ncbi:POU domain, class 6, transcription factor 1 isoform X2 [Ambystoma mexicanum]|uniref:POU domain, class 6, transcription factor 1 isoform X2 n=1 Tax=Ambystoma mexicanum TaxID=8296 RepID=UPI0037E73361